MTWIKTLSMEDDERVKKAMLAQRSVYPVEYATPVHPENNGQSSSIVASHSLIPDALFHAFSTFGALMSPELPLQRRHVTVVIAVSRTSHRQRRCAIVLNAIFGVVAVSSYAMYSAKELFRVCSIQRVECSSFSVLCCCH